MNTAVLPETEPATESKLAVVPDVKPVPSIVTVAAPEPAGIEAGLTRVTVGAVAEVAFTLNVKIALVPPPGEGFVTNTWYVPATSALAAIVVVNDVNVEVVGEVCSAPMLMIDVPLKLLPLRVIVSGPLAAVASIGEILMRTGTAFSREI